MPTIDIAHEGSGRPPTAGAIAVLRHLHDQCSLAMDLSMRGDRVTQLGETYLFASDLDTWRSAINGQPEAKLIETAASEYVMATVNLCQAQYRNAFKGLRLVLELCLQSTHLSANLVLRAEWLKGESDTIWATLIDPESGPLSTRSVRAFFPDLEEDIAHFRQLAKTLYRELSECIHGNMPNHIPLPARLDFTENTFEMWQSKARSVRLVVHFAFALRYLLELPREKRVALEPVVTGQLGHIEAIRTVFEQGK